MDFTVTVPEGTTNHGNPHLICTPPQLCDYVLFYFANYFAHAATIISYPGQSRNQTVVAVVLALLLPTSGVARAIGAIRGHVGTIRGDELKRAHSAGALCMVVVEAPPRRRGEGPLLPTSTDPSRPADSAAPACKTYRAGKSTGTSVSQAVADLL